MTFCNFLILTSPIDWFAYILFFVLGFWKFTELLNTFGDYVHKKIWGKDSVK